MKTHISAFARGSEKPKTKNYGAPSLIFGNMHARRTCHPPSSVVFHVLQIYRWSKRPFADWYIVMSLFPPRWVLPAYFFGPNKNFDVRRVETVSSVGDIPFPTTIRHFVSAPKEKYPSVQLLCLLSIFCGTSCPDHRHRWFWGLVSVGDLVHAFSSILVSIAAQTSDNQIVSAFLVALGYRPRYWWHLLQHRGPWCWGP